VAAVHGALLQVFESSRFLGKQGWRFAMQASMLEIYNEEYKDLLARKKMPDGKVHKVCGPCKLVLALTATLCWRFVREQAGRHGQCCLAQKLIACIVQHVCHTQLCKQQTAPRTCPAVWECCIAAAPWCLLNPRAVPC
jgi:hypothetical protein